MKQQTASDACVDEATLMDFFAGGLPAAEVAAIERHLDTCEACSALVLVAAPVLASGPEQAGTPWGLPPGLRPGKRLLDRYLLEELIGWGATGHVFRAQDALAGGPVAIKVLREHYAAKPAWMERFTRELRVGRALNHPHVCRVFDLQPGDPCFLVMELGERSLHKELRLGEVAERSLDARLRDAIQVSDGLAAIHAAGIIHRDVKPENVLRMKPAAGESDGRLVLSDFGHATLSPKGAPATLYVGTPQYMAPEVVAGEPATRASDLWSLGLVLHEVVFGKKVEWQTRDGKRTMKPRTGDARERAVSVLCTQCLDEVPGNRPRDARGVAARLAEIRAGRELGRGVGRRIFAGASLALVGAAAVGAGVWLRRRGRVEVPGPLAPATLWLAGASTPSFARQGAIAVVARSPGRGIDVVHTREAGRRELLEEDGRDPALAPDARTVAFVRGAGEGEEIWLRAVEGGAARRLVAGAAPQWSADGATVYFHDRARKAIRAVAPGGGEAVDFFADALAPYPGVTAGGHLVGATAQGAVIVDRQTRAQVFAWPVPGHAGLRAALSPDGRLLAFGGADNDALGVWVTDVETRRAIRVKAGPFTAPVWHPSGTHLAFDRRPPGGATREVWRVEVGDVVGALAEGLDERAFATVIARGE